MNLELFSVLFLAEFAGVVRSIPPKPTQKFIFGGMCLVILTTFGSAGYYRACSILVSLHRGMDACQLLLSDAINVAPNAEPFEL